MAGLLPPVGVPSPFPRRVYAGLALLSFALFVFASPGRLDTIDAMPRAEVATSLLTTGRPEILDPRLFHHPLVQYNGAWYYSSYSAPPSLVGAVAIAVGRLVFGATTPLDRVYFLCATAAVAAVGVVLLLDVLRRLGAGVGSALSTCLVTAGATLLLPYGGSAFDQAQHATVAVAVVWATLGALQGPTTARWLLPGLCVGAGLAYREVHGVWLLGPALAALVALRGRDRIAAWAWLAAGVTPGIALVLGWNVWRTGTLLPAVVDQGFTLVGNPLVGLAGLTVSPGKGILWFSPPVLLGLVGLRRLAREHLAAALAVVGVAAAHTALYSCLSFFSGDWCWGPRYMLVPAVVLMVGAPWAGLAPWARRGIVVAGLLVQLLALGRDYAVYIYEHRLPTNFQYEHPEVQFTGSALASRPAEIAEMFTEGVPSEVEAFRSGDPGDDVTNANTYQGPPEVGPAWMRAYAVFWLPVPWWSWMPLLPPDSRPYPPTLALALVGGLFLAGLLLLPRDGAGGGPPRAQGLPSTPR